MPVNTGVVGQAEVRVLEGAVEELERKKQELEGMLREVKSLGPQASCIITMMCVR